MFRATRNVALSDHDYMVFFFLLFFVLFFFPLTVSLRTKLSGSASFYTFIHSLTWLVVSHSDAVFTEK